MPSSLGVYIDNNVIKYAKVTKGAKGSYKVDSFNVEFYDNLGETISKILQDTNSYKTPIGINISDELYNYYQVFAMLSKKDMKDSIEIDFESDCMEKNYNISSLESRYILTGANVVGAEQLRALHISARKGDLGARMDKFAGARVASATPITTSITNLLEINPKENVAIINIENETKITTIIDGEISEITILEDGMGKILEQIAQTENSVKKAYEVCKNIPLYNQQEGGEAPESEHAQEIMPILYKIATESKKIIDEAKQTIDKVYITGSGTIFNGIDLYFGDYMVNVKCELLKPYFAESTSIKVPIKEYMEVNSAIALAMDALGDGIKELNFATGGKGSDKKKIDLNADVDMNQVLDKLKGLFKPKPKPENHAANAGGIGENDLIDNVIIRLGVAVIIAIMAFSVYSGTIERKIAQKSEEVSAIQSKNSAELTKMDEDINEIKGGYKPYADSINEYKRLIESQETVDEQRVIAKDAIPNMLNRIMFLIPEKSRLTKIENTQDTHIVIEAESLKYEQLGYFTSVLKTEGVLVNVKSTSGSKKDGVVSVTIEGDLP